MSLDPGLGIGLGRKSFNTGYSGSIRYQEKYVLFHAAKKVLF
jgi:hypothetical protein